MPSLYDMVEEEPVMEYSLVCSATTCDLHTNYCSNSTRAKHAFVTKSHDEGWRVINGRVYCRSCVKDHDHE